MLILQEDNQQNGQAENLNLQEDQYTGQVENSNLQEDQHIRQVEIPNLEEDEHTGQAENPCTIYINGKLPQKKSLKEIEDNSKYVQTEVNKRRDDFLCQEQISKTQDRFSIYGQYVVSKLKNYSPRIRAIVEHSINNVLFSADIAQADGQDGVNISSGNFTNPFLPNFK